MKKIIYFIFYSTVLIAFPVSAQEMFSGTLPDWDGGTAQVVSMGGEPIPVGTINKSGKFQIPLGRNFLEKTENAMKAYNDGPGSGSWRLNTISKAYSCYEDTLNIINGDQKMSTLATFGGTFALANIKEKKLLGHFMLVNSFDFAKAFSTFSEMNAVEGYYLDWYYVNEPAKIQGECITKTYALNQEEFYDGIKVYELNFDAGWNLVKISADKIFTDRDGKKYVSQWTYATIPTMPEDVKYLYFPEPEKEN